MWNEWRENGGNAKREGDEEPAFGWETNVRVTK